VNRTIPDGVDSNSISVSAIGGGSAGLFIGDTQSVNYWSITS